MSHNAYANFSDIFFKYVTHKIQNRTLISVDGTAFLLINTVNNDLKTR